MFYFVGKIMFVKDYIFLWKTERAKALNIKTKKTIILSKPTLFVPIKEVKRAILI